jgi:type VII secretion integral membrane protein EccD
VTGVGELHSVEVVSAVPDQFRVSVLGGNTQLDVALPSDVPVAAFLPELAQLIRSREARRDDEVAGRDERRTFWVLSRIDGGGPLAPNETLRAAGVSSGDLLRISAQRALTPPMLYDDVVDAAARLNRAAYAAWSPTAAKVMAFAGLWLIAAVWVMFLSAEALTVHRTAVVIGAGFITAILIVGAAVVHRALDLTDIGVAAGWAALAMTAGLAWVLATPWGTGGLAVGCAVLLVLSGVYYRVIGTGHWAYIAAAVSFTLGGIALLARALGGHVDVVASVTATAAALSCLAIPTLTRRWARFPTSTSGEQPRVDDPFMVSEAISSAAGIPSAEQVWDRVRAVELARSGLLAGLAVGVVGGAAVLLNARTELSAFSFALICAAVLALRSRRAPTWFERGATAVPAVALMLIACVQAQSGTASLRLAGVGVLAAVAAFSVLSGFDVSRGKRVSTAVAYLDYVTVAALVPLALWPLGVYDRLGLW